MRIAIVLTLLGSTQAAVGPQSSGECTLEFSGTRNFFNPITQTCEPVNQCPDELLDNGSPRYVLWPATNQCEDHKMPAQPPQPPSVVTPIVSFDDHLHDLFASINGSTNSTSNSSAGFDGCGTHGTPSPELGALNSNLPHELERWCVCDDGWGTPPLAPAHPGEASQGSGIMHFRWCSLENVEIATKPDHPEETQWSILHYVVVLTTVCLVCCFGGCCFRLVHRKCRAKKGEQAGDPGSLDPLDVTLIMQAIEELRSQINQPQAPQAQCPQLQLAPMMPTPVMPTAPTPATGLLSLFA